MATGTVKWFDAKKKFGFISPDGGGGDVFVHITAVEKAGWSTLQPDQRLAFELTEHKGRQSASELKAL
jgi:CspA family cold shock protein